MRGIISYGGYVPWWRLPRQTIGAAHGGAAGGGTRAVASYDEDTTSMAVEAGRLGLRPLGDDGRRLARALWFATTSPSYTDKTNATTVHAALRLDRDVPAFDAVGSVRSASGALIAVLQGSGTALVVASDTRTGLPNSADERDGGDGAAALLIGDDTAEAPVIAEYLGGASTTEEFVDRWRVPGEVRSRAWEERFGETRYVPLGTEAWKLALDRSGVAAEDIRSVVIGGLHGRAVKQVTKGIGASNGVVADDLSSTVGNTGAAQVGLALAHVLDTAEPGAVIAVVSLSDGADVSLFRTTDAIAGYRPARPVADQLSAGNPDLPYLKFLSWKGVVTVQPPNRPEPARVSSSAAARHDEWKYGFVTRSEEGDLTPLADVTGTIATFTVDRLAYSPSPPIVFAVVDLEGDASGRMPIELTDVVADDVRIGDRVEMTFRRLNQSDGIQNYFWKAKPVR